MVLWLTPFPEFYEDNPIYRAETGRPLTALLLREEGFISRTFAGRVKSMFFGLEKIEIFFYFKSVVI